VKLVGIAGLDTQKLQLLSEKQANWLKAAGSASTSSRIM
jgi:hypothetical protein